MYLQVDHIPANELTQLFFYTEINGEIFWGTDNNSIDPEDIERWVKDKKILKLKNPILIEENETLTIGYTEPKVYISNYEKRNEKVLCGKLSELIETSPH